MAKVKIQGHASGSGVFTITAPNSNTDRTITLPDASVTLGTDATKLPLAGGALTGAVTTNSTFDGRDVAADGVLATNALPKAGGTLTGATNLTVNQTANTQFSIVNNSGGGTAAASLKVQTGGAASGDPFIHINNEIRHISMGIDNSDGDKFKISDATTLGSNDRFVIDSTGTVTMPLQPAFLVELSGVQSDIAINTSVVCLFNTERFDQNSDFNTSNYTFTAPTVGKYQLNTYLRLQNVDSGAGYYHIYLITSNRVYFDIIQPVFTADVTYMNMAVNVLADMDANDTAKVHIYQASGTQQTDLGYNNDSHFSGYLVC